MRIGHYIFRPWYINPATGEKIYAKDYGYKAWKIWVDDSRN
ncbi:MAG: hypothetical protein WCS17_13020 [Prevotella sp.]